MKEQILSPSIQGLIAHMRETVRDAPGVGLAALEWESHFGWLSSKTKWSIRST